VATPDRTSSTSSAAHWGVPRAPDEEVRTSGEILERRDRYRWDKKPEVTHERDARALVGGAGLGAGLMYLLDPERG